MPFAFSTRPLILLTALGSLAGCAGLSNSTSVNLPNDQPLRLAGELTTASAVNVNNGSRYQSFTLQLAAGEVIEVRATSGYDNQLTLLDAQNRLVHGPRDSVLSLAPTQAGRYQLNLSADSATGYGPFSMNLARIQVRNSGTLANNERLAGILKQGTANNYQLEVSEPAVYRFKLSSDEIDTVLRLKGNNLTLENDDSDDSTQSRIDAFLQPGRYELTAASIDEAAGSYVLSSEQRALPAGITLSSGGRLQPNTPINGLGSSAPLNYQLQVEETALVTLRMKSSEIDAHLTLSGKGVDISDDDGAGSGTDAQLSALLEPGQYTVAASSVNQSSGIFSLSYSLQPIARGALNDLRPAQYANGTLSSNAPVHATLRISTPGEYVIDLTSSDFDAFLRLQGGELTLEDDDSGGARNARLTTHLDAGEYRLQISGVDASSRGRFSISVMPAIQD